MEENDIIYSLLTFALFVLLLVISIILLVLNYLKNKKRLLAENETIKAEFHQTILQTQLEIQEQVLTQVSQEIHDNIGQILSLVRLNINTLALHSNQEKLKASDELLGKAIQDLRNLSHILNTNYIREVGLVEAISQLVANIQRTGQFKTHFYSESATYEINDERAIIIFRIVQEIFTNIIRHANASEISVCISNGDKFNSIVITDNGTGFDLQSISDKKGLGISNMKSRSKLVGLNLEFQSAPSKGTKVVISEAH